ncbi:MAG: hypothetical protein GVY14_01910, partial [Spirochaetes bacterium]|jgi:hypothetical protein|nr:hypothetical protein [Spirochaetota bacterium]
VRLRAEWDGGGSQQWLLGDGASYENLAASRAAATKSDVAGPINARPTDLQLYYDFGTSSAVATGNEISSLHVRFEITFALETVGESFLDIEDDQGDNELAMDDDIFDRDPEDPDEDLDDFLDALRGSSAELVMKLDNTTGFGATLAMVNGAADWETIGGVTPEEQEAAKQDPANWVVDLGIASAESLQQVELDISAATLDEFIDGVPDPVTGVSQFKPEFLIELPWNGVGGTPQPENQFSIKKGAAFNVTEGYLRVQADFDYTYDLEDEE